MKVGAVVALLLVIGTLMIWILLSLDTQPLSLTLEYPYTQIQILDVVCIL